MMAGIMEFDLGDSSDSEMTIWNFVACKVEYIAEKRETEEYVDSSNFQ